MDEIMDETHLIMDETQYHWNVSVRDGMEITSLVVTQPYLLMHLSRAA